MPRRTYSQKGLRRIPNASGRRALTGKRSSRAAKSRQNRKLSMIHFHKRRSYNANEKIIDLVGNTSASRYLDVVSSARFQLDYVQNYTDLSSLYDKYQICAIRIKYYWSPSITQKDGANIVNVSSVLAPMMRYHIDYDDDTTPNWDVMGADARTKQVRILPGKPVSIYLKPKVLQMVYETISTTGYSSRRLGNIDCADPDVPHYGLKTVIRYPNVASGEASAVGDTLGEVYTETTYYLKMKYPQT